MFGSSLLPCLICVFVFALFVFVLCLVYPMLLVTLDCSFVITPLVFSSVYSSQLATYYAYLILFVQLGSPTNARLNTLNTGPGYHAFSHILVGEDYFFFGIYICFSGGYKYSVLT